MFRLGFRSPRSANRGGGPGQSSESCGSTDTPNDVQIFPHYYLQSRNAVGPRRLRGLHLLDELRVFGELEISPCHCRVLQYVLLTCIDPSVEVTTCSPQNSGQAEVAIP